MRCAIPPYELRPRRGRRWAIRISPPLKRRPRSAPPTSALPACRRADVAACDRGSTAPPEYRRSTRPPSPPERRARTRSHRGGVRGPRCQNGSFLGPRQRGVGQHIPWMIEYRTGMQNGVQVIDIFIEVTVWIGHCRPPVSFRCGTENDLENPQKISRGRKKFFPASLKIALPS